MSPMTRAEAARYPIETPVRLLDGSIGALVDVWQDFMRVHVPGDMFLRQIPLHRLIDLDGRPLEHGSPNGPLCVGDLVLFADYDTLRYGVVDSITPWQSGGEWFPFRLRDAIQPITQYRIRHGVVRMNYGHVTLATSPEATTQTPPEA